MEKKKLTDYELGNFVLFNIGDTCLEAARDCRDSHPTTSDLFSKLGHAFIKYGQSMEERDPKDPRHDADKEPVENLEVILREDIENAVY